MKKLHELTRSISVPRAAEEVFVFFERPENLALITPPWLDFHLITPSPVEMRRGALIDYTIRLMGWRVSWRTVITEHDPPRRFVDEQLRGPYLHWRHIHTFEPADGGTLVKDQVFYAIPGGPLSGVAHTLYVRPRLEEIFNYRAQRIREALR